ncbi:MAG: class B sortase [Lachnospiraceae bacterium]|nr:class B sortase [Lachnospiraceae bacterium]
MKKKIMSVLMIVCLMIAAGCGGYLTYYYYSSGKSEKNIDKLRDMIEEEPVVISSESSDNADEPLSSEDNTTEEVKQPETQNNMVAVDGTFVQRKFEVLYGANHDFVGWIKIKDTNIDYPVMFTPDDDELGQHYIHLDFDEEYSSAGLPFIDGSCMVYPATDNIIIYGHNMNSGKMFHDIMKYEDKDFYESHKTFDFDTIYGEGTYEVVAAFYSQIYPEDSDEFKYYRFVNAGDESEFNDYVENIKKLSIIDTGVDVKYGDKLVTLSTCAYHVKDGRFAVVAQKVEK